jgi:uncharacterized protein YjbI with pentapeptide repeats
MVEVHGLFFDIILFGIILSIYETLIDNKSTITRYLEEIDDFRGWHEDEAAFRVAGILKRLEKQKVLNVDLSGLNLKQADKQTIVKCKHSLRNVMLKLTELDKLDLSGSQLQGAQLYGCYMRGTNLEDAKLNHADLKGTNLTGVNFSNADLSNADLLNSILRGAIMRNTKLKNANLRSADLTGANLVDADLTGVKVYAHQVEIIRLCGGDISKLFIVPLPEKKNQ